ncbi:MAG: helix-turn-helix transcriptional regulator [Frankiaceae bacterium]|nr:helix-turn-helix transcriptional regulator [Frankiaceae bacterium]
MDVPRLLTTARSRAAWTRDELAAAAGTSRSALAAYEGGRRSPTVATLDRLLAACGLQIRAVLEPDLADLDAAVDALLVGPRELPDGLEGIAAAFDDAHVCWAFDGSTALALHGLAAGGTHAQVVAVGSDELRRLMYGLGGVGIVDRDGEPLWDSWLAVDLTRVGVCSAYTRIGALSLRVVSELGDAVRITPGGRTYPTLALWDVEQAHPALAEVLARLRERRTV